jgi:hypothetical protein
VPVVKVKGNLATCNGGGGALGHPIESRAGARFCCWLSFFFVRARSAPIPFAR